MEQYNGISTLYNMRCQGAGQIVVMPHGLSQRLDIEQLKDIVCAYAKMTLLHEENAHIIICTPTMQETHEIMAQIHSDRLSGYAFNGNLDIHINSRVKHAILLMPVDAYTRIPSSWFNSFQRYNVKLTTFIFRTMGLSVDEFANDEQAVTDLLFEYAPNTVEASFYASSSSDMTRFFIIRETNARGVVVAWIDNFPHGSSLLNEFDDTYLAKPTEPINTIIQRIQDIILV